MCEITRFHRGSFRAKYGKNSSHFKIFTLTPLVALATNMRYGHNWSNTQQSLCSNTFLLPQCSMFNVTILQCHNVRCHKVTMSQCSVFKVTIVQCHKCSVQQGHRVKMSQCSMSPCHNVWCHNVKTHIFCRSVADPLWVVNIPRLPMRRRHHTIRIFPQHPHYPHSTPCGYIHSIHTVLTEMDRN